MAFRAAPLSSGRIVPRVTIGRVTPFIPRERPNVIKHSYFWLFKATTGLHQRMHWCGCCICSAVELRNQGMPRRLRPNTRRLQLPLDDCCRLMISFNAEHSIQQTDQIPNDPPRMGAKSTTTSNHPSTPKELFSPSANSQNFINRYHLVGKFQCWFFCKVHICRYI